MPHPSGPSHSIARAASITVHVPAPLRASCEGASDIVIEATSLRDLLADLARRHPALHRGICDETGAVRRHINLFVNNDHMRDRHGLDTPLVPGDVVTIMPAVSGG
jgi:molybdopterin converting factor small subunit